MLLEVIGITSKKSADCKAQISPVGGTNALIADLCFATFSLIQVVFIPSSNLT